MGARLHRAARPYLFTLTPLANALDALVAPRCWLSQPPGPQGRRARAVAHRADPDTRHTGDDHLAGRRLAGRRLEGRWLAADRNGSADDAAGTPPELTSSSAVAPPSALASWRPPFPAQANSEVSSRSLVFSSSWLFLSPFSPFPSSPGTPATDPVGALPVSGPCSRGRGSDGRSVSERRPGAPRPAGPVTHRPSPLECGSV